MADPTHVLKTITSQLLHVDTFNLGEDTVREHNLPGAAVSIDHVLRYDSNNDYKSANRLTGIHTSTGHYTKIKVNIALQLFREAPPTIRYLNTARNQLTPEAEETA